jgi:hypothetical protein
VIEHRCRAPFELAKFYREPTTSAMKPEPECRRRAAQHLRCLSRAQPLPSRQQKRLPIILRQASQRLEDERLRGAAIDRVTRLNREAVDQPSLAAIGAPRVRQNATRNSEQPPLRFPGKLTATSPRDLEGLRNGVIRERGSRTTQAIGAHLRGVQLVQLLEIVRHRS